LLTPNQSTTIPGSSPTTQASWPLGNEVTPPQGSLNEGAEGLVELRRAAGLTVASVEPITLVQRYPGAQALWDGGWRPPSEQGRS
jgi:hypothetical protein